MDNFATDEERLEALKAWWNNNSSSLLVGIVVAVGILLGWQWWTSHQQSQVTEAAGHYERFLLHLEKGQDDDVRKTGQAILEKYPNSGFAALAALQLAKIAVTENNDNQAAVALNWILKNSRDNEFKTMAHLRLAKVYLDQKRLKEAEKQLQAIDDKAFMAEKDNLMGDLYLLRNQPEKARQAWQAAILAGNRNPLLPMKLANLPATSP